MFLTLRLRLRAVWLCMSSHCVRVVLSDHALRALFSLAPIRRLITRLLPHLRPLPLPPGSFGPEHPACSSPSLVVHCDLLIFSRFPALYASALSTVAWCLKPPRITHKYLPEPLSTNLEEMDLGGRRFQHPRSCRTPWNSTGSSTQTRMFLACRGIRFGRCISTGDVFGMFS